MAGETNRLPLVLKPENRDQTSAKDAKIINAFVEKKSDEEYEIYKRPGLSVYQSLGASTGLGVYNWNNDIYSVFGTTLYKNGVSIGTVDGTHGKYSFSSNQNVIPQLFLHNGAYAYVWNGTTLSTVTNNVSTVVSLTCSTTSASTTVTTTGSTSSIAVGDSVTGPGIPNSTYVVSITDATHFVISFAATATQTNIQLNFTGAGYPGSATTPICHGVAWLDGTTYVIDTSAKIWGSNLNDSTAWMALNYITAQSEQDGGVAIARQLANIIALKQWTTEVFYDAANSIGSPLLPVSNSKQPFGCVNADSIVSISDRLIWLGTNKSGAKQVVLMENLVCKAISTQPIERLLDTANCSQAYGWSHKEMGHIFYGLTLPLANYTFVYDLTSGVWYQWTDPNGNYFPVVDSTFTSAQGHLMQHISSGNLLTPSATTYSDQGVLFPVDLYTPKFDGGTRFSKMLTSLEVIGDTVSGSILNIRFSDDDYKSWTNFRSVNLFENRPILWDCGTFRSRAFHLRHLSNTPMRISSVDLQLRLGTL